MPVTQKQIAKEVGFSQALVGLAMSGGGRMQPATRDAIVSTALRLGYSPSSNIEARRLVARRHGRHVRTRMIAVLAMRHYSGRPLFDLPLPQGLLLGIQSEALSRDLDILVAINRETALPRLISAGLVDGIITFEDIQDRAAGSPEKGVPVVGLMTYGTGLARIEPDDFSGMRAAVDHLIGLGHERIAFAGVPQTAAGTPTGRYKGYLDAMHQAALNTDASIADFELARAGEEDGCRSLPRLLARRPDITAIACINDHVAAGMLEYARSTGIPVPDDLSIVGFGDFLPFHGTEPILTSVAFDRCQMGRRAVEWIETAAEGDATAVRPDRIEVFPTTLVVRRSSGPPRRLAYLSSR